MRPFLEFGLPCRLCFRVGRDTRTGTRRFSFSWVEPTAIRLIFNLVWAALRGTTGRTLALLSLWLQLLVLFGTSDLRHYLEGWAVNASCWFLHVRRVLYGVGPARITTCPYCRELKHSFRHQPGLFLCLRRTFIRMNSLLRPMLQCFQDRFCMQRREASEHLRFLRSSVRPRQFLCVSFSTAVFPAENTTSIYQSLPILSHCTENSASPCDTGSPVSILQAEFPTLDFSAVDPIYPEKANPLTNPYAFTRRAVVQRGQTCLEWLYNRPEKIIAVVSHSGFLRCSVSQRRYANADYRVFDLKKNDGKGFVLKEWEQTEKNGGGMGRSETGIAQIEEWDFPKETDELGEATAEVPNQ